MLLPVLLLEVFAQAIAPWFTAPGLSLSADQLVMPDFVGILRGVWQLNFRAWTGLGGHTWYITELMRCLLYFIPMKLVATHPDKRVCRGVAAFVLVMTCISSVRTAYPATTLCLPPSQLIFPCYFVMLMVGQEMYAARERLRSGRVFCAGLAGFVLLTAGKYLLNRTGLLGYDLCFSADSPFTFLSLPFLYMMFLPIRLPERAADVIRRLAKKTFYVYLLHPLINDKLRALGVFDRTFAFFIGKTPILMLDYLLMCLCNILIDFTIAVLLTLPFTALHKAIMLLRSQKKAANP
ncbi:MAG: hypothetical protein Q4C54_07115 [Clostridia bacterium]|nr:hypothetical protein [Clostridia bacterium]